MIMGFTEDSLYGFAIIYISFLIILGIPMLILYILYKVGLIAKFFNWLLTRLGIEETEFNVEIVKNTDFERKVQKSVVFSHGFGDNKKQFNKYSKIFEGYNIYSFDYPDAIGGENAEGMRGILKRSMSYLGQGKDMESLSTALNTAGEINDLVVGFGVSRGSITYLNVCGKLKGIRKPDMLILEAPALNIDSVGRNLVEKVPLVGKVEKVKTNVPRIGLNLMFKNFSKDGEHPADLIHDIPADIPILFVHSARDELISVNDSKMLYIARYRDLQSQGKAINVHYKELPGRNRHAMISEEDFPEYARSVRHFLDRYGGELEGIDAKLINAEGSQEIVDQPDPDDVLESIKS